MPAWNISREQQEKVRNQPWGTKQWESAKWMNRSTLCKSSSNSVTRAVAIDRCPITQVYHLVQAQLSAVDRGSLGLQGNDQLLGVFRRCHSCLWERRDQTSGVGNPAAPQPLSAQGCPQPLGSAGSPQQGAAARGKGLHLGIVLPTLHSTTAQAVTGRIACTYHAKWLTEHLCTWQVEKRRKSVWNLEWLA